MLSHVLGSGRSSAHGGTSEYHVPDGQATIRSANHFHQYQHYGTPGQIQAPPVQTLNNVVGTPGNRTATDSSMANRHWYQPPQSSYNYVAPSNSREMRNKAEKQRRDRLNAFIGELATLVPLVSRSAKRLDKTSILRLTATHLRINQTLVKGKGAPHMKLPPHVDQFVLEQLICDQMGGFLLILSPSGKIIFVSHTVETLLGHLQTDLMGQSLFTVTAPEDHDRLRFFLGCEGEMEQDWRKYFNMRMRRAGPKSETPQYESVRMMGVHRHLRPENSTSDSSSTNEGTSSPAASTSSISSLQTSINTDILIFFVKLSRPQPLVDRLVAASKDEYVTRHLIDGRIVGCDQRISLIAGYMIDEIQGHSAFQYMHRDDVRFVMIALRQMYDKGESRGNSCYRLKSRNGQFIYLKTFGFLEIDDQGIVESFICINVQVDEKEGKHHIEDMKRRYSALFRSSLSCLPYTTNMEENHFESMTNTWMSPPFTTTPKLDRTEDPQALEVAINELMQNLPSPGSDETEQQLQVQSPLPMEDTGITNPSSTVDKTMTLSGKRIAECTVTKPHLRIKSSSKRAPSMSPDHVKRQRLNSLESEPPKPSPPMNPPAQPYPNGQSLPKMPKLDEHLYPTTPSDIMHPQQHHTA